MGIYVTRDQVEALRRAAEASGDAERVALCDRALNEDSRAWDECQEIIWREERRV